MRKEFFKTMLLYFLVFFAVFMTVSIWGGKELWSEDYSSFVRVKNIFSSDENNDYILKTKINSSDCYSFEWISFCDNGMRNIKYSGEDGFLSFADVPEKIRGSLARAGTISYVSDDDYKNAFKGNGVALKFSSKISLGDYLGCDQNFFDIIKKPYADTAFLTVSSDSSTKYLYFYDYKTNQNYRLPVDYNSEYVFDAIRREISSSRLSDSFSFELNFDKKNEDMERIMMDSLVPVTLSEKSIHKVSGEILDYRVSDTVYDGIFKKFNIKKNSARSYTDNENVISFIESHATLKIYENGIFSYEAGENSSGLSLGGSDEIESAVLFANSLYRDCVDSDTFLSLKNIYEADGSTVYEFVYTTEDIKLYSENEDDVIMKVKNGNIIYYKQRLMKISKLNSLASVGSLINAYDAVYNEGLDVSKKDLEILDLHPVNVSGKGNVIMQRWCVEFSDGTFEYLKN